MKTILSRASSVVCWLFVFLVFSSCSITRSTHRQSSRSEYSTMSVADSLSQIIRLTSWSGSTTDVTMRQIIFDTSRLDSTGHPLPVSETVTVIHRQDTARTVVSDTVTHTTSSEQQASVQEQQTSETNTRSRFLMLSNVISLALVIIACIIMVRIAIRDS